MHIYIYLHVFVGAVDPRTSSNCLPFWAASFWIRWRSETSWRLGQNDGFFLLFGHPFLHFFWGETTDFLSCSIILFWQNDRDKRFFDWTTIEKWFLYYFSLFSAGFQDFILLYTFSILFGGCEIQKKRSVFSHWTLSLGHWPGAAQRWIYDDIWL